MKNTILLLLIFSVTSTFAQNKIFIPKEIAAAYKKQSRSKNGKPGPEYFQNSANYTLDAEFNPIDGKLTANGKIKYFNNSQDTLNKIVLMLYPNLYKKGFGRKVVIKPEDIGNGLEIDWVRSAEGREMKTQIHGTHLIIILDQKLSPKQSISFDIAWGYNFPMKTLIREGRYLDSSYFVAYWYPHIVVYDDIYGWDMHHYNGEQEFYNDFADYEINLKVPGNYLMWASGELQNPKEVYSDFVISKLSTAYQSDDIINIVNKGNIEKRKFTTDGDYHIWKFSAKSLTDFAFALSSNYLWDATSVVIGNKRVKVNAVYNPNSADFHEVASLSAQSLKLLSEKVMHFDYPYPQLTAFNGHYGMEFPMMINDGDGSNPSETIFITAHEIAHTWFPFIVATNENRYAWMDEGLVTYLPKKVEDILSEEENYRSLSKILNSYSYYAGTKSDLPIMIPSDQLIGRTYMYISYNRSAIAFYILEDILGTDTFKRCMTEFINRWSGKHPTAYDLFFTFEDISGRNLNWFWKPWFFSFGYADLGIEGVNQKGKKHFVTIEDVGGFPTPIYLKLLFDDGSEQLVYRSANIWEDGKKTIEIEIESSKEIKTISIDHLYSPDGNRDNNSFSTGN